MVKANDFYVSVPYAKKGSRIVSVVIAPKKYFDQNGFLNNDSLEYEELLKYLLPNISEGFHEDTGNVFSPISKVNPAELEQILEDAGFVYNPELDDLAVEFLGASKNYMEKRKKSEKTSKK